MTRCSVDIVVRFCAAYAARDYGACIALCSDDVITINHLDKKLVPHAGVSIGKAQLMRRFRLREKNFELPYYRVVWVCGDGDSVKSRSRYLMRHRATGEEIEGTVCIDWQLRDGLVRWSNHYHDRCKVEAFHRFVAAAMQVDA